MTEVKVLIEGYVKEGNNCELASSTTVLIKENNLKIIVDPGMNRQLLLDALTKENLVTGDINYVFLTHDHIDHCFLMGIFENAKVLYGDDIYSANGEISQRTENLLGANIEIIKTPGHNSDCQTILVKSDEGTVAVCADVFWWSDDQVQKIDQTSLLAQEDAYMQNKEILINSRKKVLEIADYIIPGHGKMFKVEK